MDFRRAFTAGKSKNLVNINDTEVYPKKLTMIGGDFEGKYLEQLEKLIFNHDEVFNYPRAIPLIVMTEMLKDGDVPIGIRCDMSANFKRKMVNVFITFFEKHYETMEQLYDMYMSKL